MELNIEKYQRECNVSNLLKVEGDALEDVVFSYVFRFDEPSRAKDNYAVFTLHFLLDKYENEVVLSEHILSPNNTSGYDFFWHFAKDRKGNRKSINVMIENNYSTKLKRTDFNLDSNQLSFNEVYNLVLDECNKDIDGFRVFLKSNNIKYNRKFLSNFKNDLNNHYLKHFPVVSKSLEGDVELYNVAALKRKLQDELSNNDMINAKQRIKI